MLLNVLLVVSVVLGIWVLVLSFLFWRLISHYNSLSKGVSQRGLKAVLENVLEQTHAARQDIENLKEYCDKIEKEGRFHIQKIGLMRFNPFKDTGGDQSFILSFTDSTESGVIISGLYSRSGARWYAKKVLNGKGVDYELSEDEKKALKQAVNHRKN